MNHTHPIKNSAHEMLYRNAHFLSESTWQTSLMIKFEVLNDAMCVCEDDHSYDHSVSTLAKWAI